MYTNLSEYGLYIEKHNLPRRRGFMKKGDPRNSQFGLEMIAIIILVAAIVLFAILFPRPEPVISAPSYPRLANYFLTDRLNDSERDQLSRWPLIITGWEVQYNSPKQLQALRQGTPGIIILPYIATNEFPLKNSAVQPFDRLWASLDESDWLYTPADDYVQFWEGCRTFNLTRRATAEKLVAFVLDNLKPKYWDGVFWDNIWYNVEWYNNGHVDANLDGQPDDMADFNHDWTRNELYLLGSSRLALGQDKVIIANVGGQNLGQWIVNGRMFEDFPNCLGNTSTANLNKLLRMYLEYCEDAVSPQLVVVHSSGQMSDSTAVRFGLTFTLMGDGYFAYDEGPSNHHCLWWYESYYAPIGQPLGPAFQENGVWIREFENPDQPTLVFWNPNYEARWFDLSLPDGTTSETFVPMRDGVIYRPEQHRALASIH